MKDESILRDFNFFATDWTAVPKTEHPGESGVAYWRTITSPKHWSDSYLNAREVGANSSRLSRVVDAPAASSFKLTTSNPSEKEV